MTIVQHLVMDNKRRSISCRTKLDLNKTFKEATKAIGVAQVQISLMVGDHIIMHILVQIALLLQVLLITRMEVLQIRVHNNNMLGQIECPRMEDILTQFMQVSISNQKNTDASIKNLEVQVGQLAKQMFEHESGFFSTTIEVNPREQCKVVTTRRGIVVGLKDGGECSEKKTNGGVVKINDEKEVVEIEQKNEVLAKEEEKEMSEVEK